MARLGEVSIETRVEWVHPACSFVLNEATVLLSRASHNAPWRGDLLEQQTLITEEVAFARVSEDADAIAAIAAAVLKSAFLGEQSSELDVRLRPGELQLYAELQAQFQVADGQSGQHRPWISMQLSVDWGSESSVMGTAVVVLTKHRDWNATVSTLEVTKAHSDMTVPLLHDESVSEAAISALDEANHYAQLLKGSGGGVKVLKFDTVEPVVVPSSTFVQMLNNSQSELPFGLLWRAHAKWVHPACSSLELQKAVVACNATFILGWDAAEKCWRARLQDQQPIVQPSETRRVLSGTKKLVDLSNTLLDAANELGVPALDDVKLSSVSIPRVVMGQAQNPMPLQCDESLVWVAVDEAVWELGSKACPALGLFRALLKFERLQTWNSNPQEQGWCGLRWEAQMIHITVPNVVLRGEACAVLQSNESLHQTILEALQMHNKLGVLRIDALSITEAVPTITTRNQLRWELTLEWSSKTEQASPTCEVAIEAYSQKGKWIVEIVWQRVVIPQLSKQTRQRMGCDGGSDVGEQADVLHSLSTAVLADIQLEGDPITESTILDVAPVIVSAVDVAWMVEFQWKFPIPPFDVTTTKLVLSKMEKSPWEARLADKVPPHELVQPQQVVRRDQPGLSRPPGSSHGIPVNTTGPPPALSQSDLAQCVDGVTQTGAQSFAPSPGSKTGEGVHLMDTMLDSQLPDLHMSDLLQSATTRDGNPRRGRGVMAGPRDDLAISGKSAAPSEIEVINARAWAETLMKMPLLAHAPLPKRQE